MKKVALLSFVTGAGFGSIANQRNKPPQNWTDPASFVDVGYFDAIRYICQRPSSRLEELVKIANCREKCDRDRFEAVRLLALYWRQWTPARREVAGRSFSPDCALALAAYGRRVSGSLFFTPASIEPNVSFDRLELEYVESLNSLMNSPEVGCEGCANVIIKNTLQEVERINRQAKADAKHFQPNDDFWPFDSNVSREEHGQMQSSKSEQRKPGSLATKKLELFLTPILKFLDSAMRLDDDEMARSICERLKLDELLKLTARLEGPAKVSDKSKGLICEILANLAAFSDKQFAETQRRFVFNSGFLSLLRSWALDVPTNKTLAYQAIRALKNLDPFFGPKLRSSVGLYFPIWRNATSAKLSSDSLLDVVFIHGVLGGAVHTWRQRHTPKLSRQLTCWPADWLPFDVDARMVGKSRFFGVQYHSTLPGLSTCVEPLDLRASHLMMDLEASGVGDNSIVWITHSFGGIFVKSMLMQNEKFAKMTKAVVFLSTPHLGSPIADQPAKYATLLGLASAELEEIKTDSPHLLHLRRAFIELASTFNYEVVSVSENQAVHLLGLRLSRIVVPDSSALGAGCGREIRTSLDHFSTCKPDDRNCPIYTTVLDIVNGVPQTDGSI